ncbi:RcnB family protein [Sphingomonas sp. Leaf343]|uniref:RcnB family protein n=1 Tax=Sphingomonas sp. Leaf343 TaxID=1736345 RepID=UPI000B2D6470|nr:RcnB family protein [Sphingomonas sp. Leaf343]
MRAIAGAGMIAAMLVAAGAADAQGGGGQRAGASYPVPGRAAVPAPSIRPTTVPAPASATRPMASSPAARAEAVRGQPQGMTRDGRWAGGTNAPGGWTAYRQPYAGWALPRYWVQPGFAVRDWPAYGLAQPQPGRRWSRYYDDAVLIDERGSVYDTVGGIDWDHDERGDSGRMADRGPPPPPPPPLRGHVPERRDSGLGGAAIGAVAGGVAGNVIAGRGNRLGGTLIGAGVGAAAGYAIDKTEDRGRDRRGPGRYRDRGRDGYRDDPGFDDRGYGTGYAPPPPYVPDGGEHWVSQDGHTTVTTSGGGGYHGGTTTTVTVQSAPVVTTTTTTEYYEDTVRYSPRRTWHAKRRVKGKALCCRR